MFDIRCIRLACAPALLAMTLAAGSAVGETEISGYGGFAHTFDSDVQLSQRNNTDLTFGNVSWDDESFKSPIYYGIRVTQWFGSDDNWGVAAEFTHAKMIAKLDGDERLGDTFQGLEFSHGHNLMTLNGRYRWSLTDRLRPYVGLGAGVAIPHVEVDLGDGKPTNEYQLAGPVAQGFLGLQLKASDLVSIFGETKLTYADISADLVDGGKLKVEPWTTHFLVGISLSF